VATIAGISRATLNRRMHAIRAAFAQERLADYFPETTEERKAPFSNVGTILRREVRVK
jgi:hypothetical protein